MLSLARAGVIVLWAILLHPVPSDVGSPEAAEVSGAQQDRAGPFAQRSRRPRGGYQTAAAVYSWTRG